MKNILITGGAGFIGSHVANELIDRGYTIRVLDNLSEQVHGPGGKRPEYLNPEAELQVGDIRDPDAVRRALKKIDAVYHFVSLVGVGQSMYDIVRYTSVNNVGTAVLLEALIKNRIQRLVVASSMSVYGEGLYRAQDGTLHASVERSVDQLRRANWEPTAPDGGTLIPVPTPEWKTPSLASVYALSKYDQERMCLILGNAYGIPTVALRFFNAYGPNQALSNPYTGVLAIFASRLLNGKPPIIYEDGNQWRDFVSVYDVARACRLAIEMPQAAGKVFNIASGRPCQVKEVAQLLCRALGKEHIHPDISGLYRAGDIRHCIPDISSARAVLKFEPKVRLEDGLVDLASWLEGQIAHDYAAEARAELESKGLMV